MTDEAGVDERPRRRGTGLWRLLPFALIALLAVGNYRYAVGIGGDGRTEITFALALCVFLSAYGRGWPETRESRTRSLAVATAAAVLLGCAAWFFWLAEGRFLPVRQDWRVVGMDLLSVWILAYYFHGWIAASRRPG